MSSQQLHKTYSSDAESCASTVQLSPRSSISSVNDENDDLFEIQALLSLDMNMETVQQYHITCDQDPLSQQQSEFHTSKTMSKNEKRNKRRDALKKIIVDITMRNQVTPSSLSIQEREQAPQKKQQRVSKKSMMNSKVSQTPSKKVERQSSSSSTKSNKKSSSSSKKKSLWNTLINTAKACSTSNSLNINSTVDLVREF